MISEGRDARISFLFLPFYSILIYALDHDLMAMTTLHEIIYADAMMQRLVMGFGVGDYF